MFVGRGVLTKPDRGVRTLNTVFNERTDIRVADDEGIQCR